MPSALPGTSITTMAQVLQAQDRIVKQFPEVEQVFRQGPPGRDAHGPGAAGDDRDRRQSDASGQMASSI